jgi:hypothetical protein
MDRELHFQHLEQAAEQNIAVGAEHIEWQQEVLTILERISMSAEAIDGARALLTKFLETQAQREQDHDRIRPILGCNLDLSSTVPLAQPVDQRNEAAGVAGVAGPDLCADRMPEHGCDDGIRASLDCNLDSSSTVPLAQPVDQRNEAAGVAGVAGPDLCADRMPVRPEAKPGPVQFDAKPGYVWQVGRAAMAWIARLAGRHRSRRDTGGPCR